MGTPAEHEGRPETETAVALVRSFVNTWDKEADTDAIGGPAQLHAWLSEAGLLDEGVTLDIDDVTHAQQFRNALRAMMIANHDGTPPDPDALALLERATQRLLLRVHFDSRGRPLAEPAVGSGVDGALSRILTAVFQTQIEGTWERLKACGSESCEWVYFDESKNKSKAWCSMQVCGNREKARRYRERHKDED